MAFQVKNCYTFWTLFDIDVPSQQNDIIFLISRGISTFLYRAKFNKDSNLYLQHTYMPCMRGHGDTPHWKPEKI